MGTGNRQTAGMSISLTFLFGVSWISGYLFYTEIELFAYLFTITNGLQVDDSIDHNLNTNLIVSLRWAREY